MKKITALIFGLLIGIVADTAVRYATTPEIATIPHLSVGVVMHDNVYYSNSANEAAFWAARAADDAEWNLANERIITLLGECHLGDKTLVAVDGETHQFHCSETHYIDGTTTRKWMPGSGTHISFTWK